MIHFMALIPYAKVLRSEEVGRESCLVLSSPKARQRFRSSIELEREVVLVPEVFGEDDARSLGIALHARVERSGERWTITRPGEVSRALERADAQWVRAQGQAVFARVTALASQNEHSPSGGVFEVYRRSKAQFTTAPPKSIDYSALEALEVTPAGRLLARILKETSPQTWASVPRGLEGVLSNVPVNTEFQLSVEKSSLETYLAAQARLAEWSQGAGAGQIPDAESWILPKDDPRVGLHTLLLTVRRQRESPVFSLQVYDRDGTLESNAALVAEGFPKSSSPPTKTLLGTAEMPSEATRAEAASVPGNPGFRSEYLDVEVHEPLNASVREAIVLYGRAKGFAKVVACVPDDLFQSIGACLHGSTVDLDALRLALGKSNLEEVPTGSTLVIRPAHPLQEEATRVDRRPLATEYRQAVKGEFDLSALLALHAAYASCYDDRPFLATMEARLSGAFRLSDSPNWAIPHAVLAVLGELSPDERERLASGTPLILDTKTHFASLYALASYASRNTAPIIDVLNAPQVDVSHSLSALALSPTRLLADPRGSRLSGTFGIQTLVKRVSVRTATIRTVHPDTGKVSTQTGTNLVLDRQFEPIDAPEFFGQLTRQLVHPQKGFDEAFRFLWSQERRLATTFTLGDSLTIGPVTLRERIGESKTAVSLVEVPGIGSSAPQAP